MEIVRKKPCLRPWAGRKPNKSRAQGIALGAVFPFPTPCKGKSKSQPFAHTFALTGRRRLCIDTQGVALGLELTALSGRVFKIKKTSRPFSSGLECLNSSTDKILH